MEVYLDNAATTKCADQVIDIVEEVMRKDYGNPSSKHMKGLEAERYVRNSAEIIAKSLKCKREEILFTSGGTESNNTAIIGAAMANKRAGNHLIVSGIEHSSVKEPFRFLEENGFRVTYLPVNSNGTVKLDALKEALCEDTILVSCMYVNNEIGTIEPVEEIGKIVKEYNENIIFHVDAIQAYGKIKVIPKNFKADLLSVSGHKINGPKGVGFLYIKEKTKINPLILGGGQQKGMRSGTDNVPGIAGLGKAVELIYNDEFDKRIENLYQIRKYMIESLKKLDGVTINGVMPEEEGAASAPHIVSASFDNIRAEVLLHALEDKYIYVSSGSACSSNRPGLSSTLEAIGLRKDLLDSTIRFSFCLETSKQDVDYAIVSIKALLPTLRRFVRK